jgi:predicted O-linked N-acetylglucosamine transferase (SPINDLY family)
MPLLSDSPYPRGFHAGPSNAASVEDQVGSLLELGWSLNEKNDSAAALKAFQQIIAIKPNDANALIHIGLIKLQTPSTSEQGCEMIELAFSDEAEPKVPEQSQQAITLARILGRRDEANYSQKLRFLQMVAESPHVEDDCALISLATIIPGFPESVGHSRTVIKTHHERMDKLLAKPSLSVEYTRRGGEDPYLFCFFAMFHHAFYDEQDWRLAAEKRFELVRRAIPEQLYVSPHLTERREWSGSGRVQLGIISTYFRARHSVLECFRGLIENLDRSKFAVSIIDIADGAAGRDYDEFLVSQASVDRVVVLDGERRDWLPRGREVIAGLDLDMLLYLDHTMSYRIHQYAFSRLAPVQVVTHGHPTTTGISRSIMNYYVTFDAEMSLEDSQAHFTEELMLLPRNVVHSYLTPVTHNGVSLRANIRFDTLDRAHFVKLGYLPDRAANKRWYLCMQISFKRHAIFDEMLLEILRRDEEAQLLLYKEKNPKDHELVERRFKAAKPNLRQRIHFIPFTAHHLLMALYSLADVVLDAFIGGGQTTTREAFEVGAPVVTLPARLPTWRSTLVYYTIMGGFNELIAHNRSEYVLFALLLPITASLIAFEPMETEMRDALRSRYIDIAVRVANAAAADKEELRTRIRAASPKLYHSHNSVRAWEAILLQCARKQTPGQAPIAVCSAGPCEPAHDSAELSDSEVTETAFGGW